MSIGFGNMDEKKDAMCATNGEEFEQFKKELLFEEAGVLGVKEEWVLLIDVN
jgi:hypothetical protein